MSRSCRATMCRWISTSDVGLLEPIYGGNLPVPAVFVSPHLLENERLGSRRVYDRPVGGAGFPFYNLRNTCNLNASLYRIVSRTDTCLSFVRCQSTAGQNTEQRTRNAQRSSSFGALAGVPFGRFDASNAWRSQPAGPANQTCVPMPFPIPLFVRSGFLVRCSMFQYHTCQ